MIHEVIINQSFMKFLNKHENIINKIFNIVKLFKNDIPDSYKYSINFPPKRSNFKYTDKLFIGCILYISLNNSSWSSFIGPISGKQVHKKFMDYSKNNFFKKLFDSSIKEYINKNHHLSLISVDTSNISNKQSIEINSRNPYYKNKKSIKISAITDNKGSPLSLSINESNIHDVKCFDKVFSKFINNKFIKNKINKSTLLADKGYDSKILKSKLLNNKIKTLIKPNNRNTKDKNKIRKFTKHQEKIYKNRIIIEHFFGIIKRYPKINNIYEKTLNSYFNILLLISSMVLINRT